MTDDVETTTTFRIKPMGLGAMDALFIGAAILLFLQTQFVIPWLSDLTGLEPVIFWFMVGGLGVFLPIALVGWFILSREGYQLMKSDTWRDRLRFRTLTTDDFKWMGLGVFLIGLFSFLIMLLMRYLGVETSHQPSFMEFNPLTPGRYWYLLLWLPYWILNIMGEEFMWRGVMLPRNEAAIGARAWFLHAFGWLVFHLPFGLHMLPLMVPIIFVIPFIAQKTANSWTAVILHALVNGPTFVAISFGVI